MPLETITTGTFTDFNLKKRLGQHLLIKKPKRIFDDFIKFLKDSLCKDADFDDLKNVNVAFKKPKSNLNFINLHIIEIGPGAGALTFLYLDLLQDIAYRDISVDNKGCNSGINNNTENMGKFAICLKNASINIHLIEIDKDMLKILKQNLKQYFASWKGKLVGMEEPGNKSFRSKAALPDYYRAQSENIIVHFHNQDATKLKLSTIINIKNARGNVKDDRKYSIVTDNLRNGKSINLIYFFGALPYNVSKNIILRIAEEYNKYVRGLELYIENKAWDRAKIVGGFTYIIQKEVAESFVAEQPNATLLSNLIKLYVEAQSLKILEKLQPSYFSPPPKVDSAILVGRFRQELGLDAKFTNREFLNQITNILRAFSAYPRKTLGKVANILYKQKLISLKCKKVVDKLYKNKRFAELSLEDWANITGYCI